MKAIKLASIFAVSAVAAAVSTTTIAAEPVFSGNAGISHTFGATKDTLSGTEDAEIEIAIDTGVVYLEIEFGVGTGGESVTTGLEKAYVTQGALQFGRFDGTLAENGYLGVNEIGGLDLVSNSDTDDTGVRYALSDELSVSIEGTQANGVADVDSEIGMALSYVADLGAGTFGISGGSVGESSVVNVGYAMDLGGSTLAVAYAAGDQVDTDSKSGDYKEVLEVTNASISLQMTPTDATTLNIEYASNTSEEEGGVETDADGFYVYASYTAGDLDYYVEHYGADFDDYTEVGVNASF
jgi:hypothetical protein